MSSTATLATTSRFAICLFRDADLRLHDHEPLCAALAALSNPPSTTLSPSTSPVRLVPLLCVDPDAASHTWAFRWTPRVAPLRRRFWRTSVAALARALTARGSALVVRRGRPDTVLPSLIATLSTTTTTTTTTATTTTRPPAVCAGVFLHRAPCFEEAREEQRIVDALRTAGLAGVPVVRLWGGQSVFHVDDLPFDPSTSLPDVFTAFRKQVRAGSMRCPRDVCSFGVRGRMLCSLALSLSLSLSLSLHVTHGHVQYPSRPVRCRPTLTE
jgi:deoxyribodipyrimidine photo-lyase